MSSAALQSAPHQPTTVGSHSPIPATSSNRPYTAGSSQSRDPYYNQSPGNASPSSSRRPSRRPSGNGAQQQNNNPPQPQHYSPSGSGASSGAARGAVPALSSPLSATSSSGQPVMSPGDHQRGVPPIVSPRTSSNRTAGHSAPTADRTERSRRAGHANETANSPRVTTDGQYDRAERHRNNGATQVNGASGDDAAAAAAARARRRAQQSPEAIPHRPSGGREQPRATGSAAVSNNRQPIGSTSPPGGLSREASEVLNRVVISKPEVDIEREHERMLEAQPSSPNSHHTPTGDLNTGSHDAADDGARGPRSRHDHASSSGKREKNSKFGDYYLGNTLGEGEFGKVKMGWKQEGGVQVSLVFNASGG